MQVGRDLAMDLLRKTPLSDRAIQQYVMAVAEWQASIGKKTVFGTPKDAKRLEEMHGRLSSLLDAMWAEKIIGEAAVERGAVLDNVRRILSVFFMAYPNWQDVHAFTDCAVFNNHLQIILRTKKFPISEESRLRKALQSDFRKVMIAMAEGPSDTRSAVRTAICFAFQVFAMKHSSVRAYLALGATEKSKYLDQVRATEQGLLKKNQREAAIGFSIFLMWLGAVTANDAELTSEFTEALLDNGVHELEALFVR